MDDLKRFAKRLGLALVAGSVGYHSYKRKYSQAEKLKYNGSQLDSHRFRFFVDREGNIRKINL